MGRYGLGYLVVEDSVKNLMEKVGLLMKDGWRPVGGVCLVGKPLGMDALQENRYAQALVRGVNG
jgi:hypothetical protein